MRAATGQRVQAAMAQRTCGEHHEATPAKQLNCFVRSIALIERVGNALGTLAFTWATVVLLGGYPTVLRPMDDFWFATTIVFLEAARMFSRNNRLDYQVFFYTRGAVRPVGWNGLLVVVCLSNVLVNLIIMTRKKRKYSPTVMDEFRRAMITMLILTAAIRQILSVGALKLLSETLRRFASLWSPLVAIILLVPPMTYGNDNFSIGEWMVFLLLFLVVLLLTVSRLRYPRIIKLVDSTLGRKLASWRRLILNLCMLASLVMVLFVQDDPVCLGLMMGYELYALVVVSFGNLQIPAAIARVVLALLRLVPHNYYGHDMNNPAKMNLGPSLYIFYGMVLGQGILYIVACLFEIFSFFPRRSIARRVGFRGQWGVECINLYYAYAFEKYMNGDVLAPKKMSLNRFAMDCLHSYSPKMQLHGVRIMHGLLQRELSKTRTFSKLTTSTETMVKLIKMLDWTSPENSTVRLYAAKVIAELSKSLRVTAIPGTVQIVSALLNYGNQHKRGNPLLDSDGEQGEVYDSTLNITDNIEKCLNAVSGSGNLLETQEDSTGQLRSFRHKCWILRCWQRISESWEIPQEEPLTEQALLPVLAMTIIYNLAGYDQDNCLEISRASELIPKIIGFTSYCRSNTTYADAGSNVLVKSSLKLLNRLTSIDGEIGTTLRHNISRHPFLLGNLAEILRDSTSSPELRKLGAGILRNLAVDVNTRQEIGRIQVVINGLMQTFLMPDGLSTSTNADPLLRKVAGQALAMLAMDSIDNCLAMLREKRFAFIKELTAIIHLDRYRCVSASLLRSMCLHARHELQLSDLKELSYALREVLEKVLVANRAEIGFLVGLSSEICKTVPDDFARELGHGQIKQTFVKCLVDALNENMEVSDACPEISRSILEQTITMMEYDSGYASYFNHHHMSKALSMMEQMACCSANYNIFVGDARLTEAKEPLSSLVARAKQLMAFR
ncbi:hypothetical protein PR202_ga12779 [Eleusine coracana subsp. coracana]|uniref:BLE2 protein n=1 Tax=Eleusine coracana subsp. coracana TaxID=191504 RepID=A0AAV5CD25_ELECO|nr:hypothetical protein PR202_ga12779 [Eleusine coracana subsp. coracana]